MSEICPFAVWMPGPRNKPGKHNNFGYDQWGDFSPKRGSVLHDSTGPLQATLGVVLAGGVPNWQFTIDDLTGIIYQHYEVSANCWHGNDTDPDGEVRANIDLVGIEHTRPDRDVPSRLSDLAVAATARLGRWLAAANGFDLVVRYPDQIGAWTLAEHNEVGNDPTSCPSGRIPWGAVMAAVNTEEEESNVIIVETPNTEPEYWKNYLVEGNVWKHIPDPQTYRELVAAGFKVHKPEAKAWDLMTKGALFVE